MTDDNAGKYLVLYVIAGIALWAIVSRVTHDEELQVTLMGAGSIGLVFLVNWLRE